MDVSEDSSTAVGTYDYDVFLSFNGSGRRDLADKLYRNLEDAGIRAFKSEELGGGEDISSSLRRAIKRSRISIPVISDNYAQNTQCLDEVAQMLECRESQGQRIFPVYYVTDQHDIRNQMSPFTYGFTLHERGGIDIYRIEIWKTALRQVASLKGWEVLYWYDFGDVERMVSHVRQSLKEDSSASITRDVSGVSSLLEGICDYDVFLSFGPDVERDFADPLYRRLMDAGVLVVRGEDVPVGEPMVDFVPQAMKRSKISIPVISRGYARSRWCMDEIAGMVKCRKSQGQRLFPVYYQIDIYDIRNQLREPEYCFESVDPDRMGIWKGALREVASLKGWKFDQRSSGYGERIEHIISHVLQSLREDISPITMDVPVGSSPVKGTYDYDVFLSFGSDIKRDFADPFYDRLKNARIFVYIDEDIPVGEEIAGFALQAMKRSKISIPIFSNGYAGSEQRLDEVVGMLECRKTEERKVFPIYYQIDPVDIRNQKGKFGYIFTIHDKEVDLGKIEVWKRALHNVASLKGWELDKQFQDGDMERIVSHVLQSLKEDSSSPITTDVSEGSSDLVGGIPDYNVFLNFGPDTRRGFADLLYHRLKDAEVLVFRGEDIAVGEDMVDFAQQVINRSRISIPIFSRGYARSQQCLDEVVQMLECRKTEERRVFPIYYQIDPSGLRYILREWSLGRRGRRGLIASWGPWEPVDEHVGIREVHDDKIKMWKQALDEVASLERWELDDKSTDDTVESIVSKVLRVLNGDGLDGSNAGTEETETSHLGDPAR